MAKGEEGKKKNEKKKLEKNGKAAQMLTSMQIWGKNPLLMVDNDYFVLEY